MSFPTILISILAIVATFAVLIILFIGLFAMIKGGEFNQRNANRLMRFRVIFQGIAVLALGALFLLSYTGN